MPNQYSALTKDNIERKLRRKRNPITSAAQLAREFGRDTTYVRSTGGYGSRPPASFVREVKDLVGEDTYNKLRDSHSVNKAYR